MEPKQSLSAYRDDSYFEDLPFAERYAQALLFDSMLEDIRYSWTEPLVAELSNVLAAEFYAELEKARKPPTFHLDALNIDLGGHVLDGFADYGGIDFCPF